VKVIAVNQNKYSNPHRPFDNALVQISCQELAVILGIDYERHLSDIAAGSVVEISDRYQHSLSVERQVAESLKLPATLRTLADMLEMQKPSIERVTAPPASAEAE